MQSDLNSQYNNPSEEIKLMMRKMMELVCESLSDSSGKDQEEKKEQFKD